MYLYDLVAQSGDESLVEDRRGRIHRVPCPAERAREVRDCPTRYVLDAAVRDLCLELLCLRTEVIRLEDACYRLPHGRMWIEWIARGDPLAGTPPQRAGMLVTASDDGRSGTMQGFSQDGAGEPWALQLFFEFDFDRPIAGNAPLLGMGFDDARDAAAAERLFRHAVPRIDHRWLAYFRTEGGLPRAGLEQMLRAAAPDFGLLCAFLLLLSLDCTAAEPRQGIDRINRARLRSGKPALLDHVELRLNLGGHGAGSSGGAGLRGAPRLHAVRGHVVRRAGKTFWRTHHLRGDAAKGVVASRTVRVTGDREMLARELA
ncbi:hypothetical protein [Sphingomonas sp.]|uniref:hypothetical protein n=1 Tax=Sphingomonas sp. TaxID=28214 RepID=UPI001B069328|nr:hypothetical protein [Sphingomonas sp.]MBO9713456.1 hypothetical protein [Sphingomonas sp.]